MIKIILLAVLVIGAATAIGFSSSSSESCEGGRGGGNGGGRPPGGGANGGCGAGWRRLNRPSGGWCVRAFGGYLTQANAEIQCKSHGATLSGLQNMEEARIISNMALSVLNRASGSVWIGAKRTAACTRNGISSQCTATNSFYWTDNSASGIAGFVRAHQQPDNAHGKTQLWAILLSSRTSLRVKHVMWQPGMLDDVACVMNPSDPSPRAVSGYVCGKKSSRR
ncbi:C-type lectin domain-containing protein [Caenorhabditis elegans]|uniref:C-type lectin domain-containing protein n=1 Tax=Caenorhabditis elegans TaxID=6239 RepID=Q9XUI0_CAEEL|nr:C-type lectin domain-containing protein [Caenorhabditis elegans]CAB05020.1 C-type lectin domain-containing protein [Caenorhabditis elegans]|eukprot:NP_492866.1 C-type LECtin [Caenorhabditis elegans]